MKSTRIFALFLGLIVFCALTSPVYGRMWVHNINVGQADATLLEFENAAILIDAGGSNIKGTRDRDHLWKYLDDFFRDRPALKRTLYSLIVTHPHIDHTKYLMEVLRGYPEHRGFAVRNFVDNGDSRNFSDSPGYPPLNEARAFINKQNGSQKPIYNKIDAADIGPNGYRTAWLAELAKAPSSVDIRFLNASRICSNQNNDSLVVLVTHGASKILLTGDAESESSKETKCLRAIPRMLQKFGQGDLLRGIAVYKAGHHGSHNGTSDNLLELLSPKISIISAGFHTDRAAEDQKGFDSYNYAHPRDEAVKKIIKKTTGSRQKKDVYTMDAPDKTTRIVIPLKNLTKAVYCTCWDGDIVITAEANGSLDVKTSK